MCLAKKFPKIAAEWHPTKNGNLTPHDICYGTGKKYWWKCLNGHEWQASPNNRSRGKGCPYCSNQLPCDENCLLTLFPSVAAEWHPTKNASTDPGNVVAGSKKRYWFKCKKGHEWESTLDNRTQGKGCPYCANILVCSENSLQTLYPEIAAEWHPTKNGSIVPSDVVAGSRKQYWFKCKKGHEWKVRLENRINLGNGCPHCYASRGEKELVRIAQTLLERNLITKYIPQYKDERVKNKIKLPFDIALFIGNEIYVIEYQGKHHYDLVNWSGRLTNEQMNKNLIAVRSIDNLKQSLCETYGIHYLAISYKQFNQMNAIISAFILRYNPALQHRFLDRSSEFQDHTF